MNRSAYRICSGIPSTPSGRWPRSIATIIEVRSVHHATHVAVNRTVLCSGELVWIHRLEGVSRPPQRKSPQVWSPRANAVRLVCSFGSYLIIVNKFLHSSSICVSNTFWVESSTSLLFQNSVHPSAANQGHSRQYCTRDQRHRCRARR